MPRIYFAHASENKALIVPLIKALEQHKFENFLDRPSDVGLYSDTRRKLSLRGLAGGDYKAQLKEALNEADVVLTCLSKDLCRKIKQSEVLKNELAFAETSGKIASCIIDDVSREELDAANFGLHNIGDWQASRLSLNTPKSKEMEDELADDLLESKAFKSLLDQIEAVLSKGRNDASTAVKDFEEVLLQLLPLAGRYGHNGPYHLLLSSLEKMQSSNHSSPIIMMGPELEELWDVPKSLALYMKEQKILKQTPRLIGGFLHKFDNSQGVQIDDELKKNILYVLAKETRRSQEANAYEKDGDLDSLLRIFVQLNQHNEAPILCCYQPVEIKVIPDETESYVKSISVWIDVWGRLLSNLPHGSIVPVLPIVLCGAKPNWFARKEDYPICDNCSNQGPIRRLLRRRTCLNSSIYAAVSSLVERRSQNGENIEVLPVLPPINRAETVKWGNQLVQAIPSKSAFSSSLLEQICEWFDESAPKILVDGKVRSAGLNMKFFRKYFVSYIQSKEEQ